MTESLFLDVPIFRGNPNEVPFFCKGFLLDHCSDVQLSSVNILLVHFTYVPRPTIAHVFQNQQFLICDRREIVWDGRLFDMSVSIWDKDTGCYNKFTLCLQSFWLEVFLKLDVYCKCPRIATIELLYKEGIFRYRKSDVISNLRRASVNRISRHSCFLLIAFSELWKHSNFQIKFCKGTDDTIRVA